MGSNELVNNDLDKIKDKLIRDKVKLWSRPYYIEAEGVNENEIKVKKVTE